MTKDTRYGLLVQCQCQKYLRNVAFSRLVAGATHLVAALSIKILYTKMATGGALLQNISNLLIK